MLTIFTAEKTSTYFDSDLSWSDVNRFFPGRERQRRIVDAAVHRDENALKRKMVELIGDRTLDEKEAVALFFYSSLLVLSKDGVFTEGEL